jgi:hypothetical protein
MINPGTYNITAPQGASFDRTFTLTVGGTAVDLGGYDARMQVRETHQSHTPIISLTEGTGITLGGTAGTILVEITAATMGSAISGQYVYDLELVGSTGVVTRLLEGDFTITPEVTR